MQYRYTGSQPVVMIVGESLTTVGCGDVVDIQHAPSAEFVPVAPKVVKEAVTEPTPKKVSAKKTPTPKKTKSEEVTNASETETSKLG